MTVDYIGYVFSNFNSDDGIINAYDSSEGLDGE